MNEHPNADELLDVSCCPDLSADNACDVLDFHYRLIHPTAAVHNNQRLNVEVLIHARLERCPGPMVLGDLVYSTTLFPDEKVRLFSSDHRTRFSFDSASQVSYRNEQTSEERLYMSSMSDFMSDVSTRDEAHNSTSAKGSSESRSGSSSALKSFFFGGSVTNKGSYNASSTQDFLREISQHAQSSHHRSEEVTRTANSVSIGEVQSRSHAEGETEDHFKSASRVFSNPNKCHAITFFFYRINKLQTVKFTIVAIQRRVIDPAGDTLVTNNQFAARGLVGVIPNDVLATDKERLEAEARGRASVAADKNVAGSVAGAAFQQRAAFAAAQADPIPNDVRQKALNEVDAQLAANKLIVRPGGEISDVIKQRFSFEIQSSLPTAGTLVKGCLDDCNICEEEVQQDIGLDLDRKKLQNKLLEKQIELLEKSQEYRCCPGGEEETEA